MSVELQRLNAKFFSDFQQNITAYKVQAKRVQYLAILSLASLVAYITKLTFAKLSGTPLQTAKSSSMILGVFTLVIAGGTLLHWLDKNNKAKQIAEEISKLYRLTGGKFSGDTVERFKDSVTAPAVLDHMQQNLKPHRIEKDYLLIATNKVTIIGKTAETFKYSVEKESDNFNEVMATVGAWRKFYAELHAKNPNSPIMQVIATQCVQGLPEIKVLNGTQKYTCYSPSANDPKSGRICHSFQNASTSDSRFTNVPQFRKYYEELPKTSFC